MINHQSSRCLVLGASGGIGGALADSLEAAGRTPIRLSRSETGLDLTQEETIQAAAGALCDGPAFDLIINATGVLEANGRGPEKAFSQIEPETMAAIFTVNAIGAALALKHFMPLLRKQGRAVFASFSARVGSIADNRLGGWVSYRASKAALNQIVRCASIEAQRRNRDAAIIALHPGTIDTALTRKFAKGRYTASPEEAAAQLLSVITKLTPENNGGFFDYAGNEVIW